MNRLTSVLIFSSLISGCTFNYWYKDFVTPPEKLYSPKFELLALGMTKPEVISHIGRPDQMISAKRVGADLLEKWEYFRIAALPGPDQIAERFQVTFRNGKLDTYEASGDSKQQINLKSE